jgi:hypothetical protein
MFNNNKTTFGSRKESSSTHEHRIIWQNSLEDEPSASPDGGAERQRGNEGQESAERQVNDGRSRTREKADRAMDDPRSSPEGPRYTPPNEPAWKPLPKLSTRDLKRTAVVGAAVVNPVATGAVAAGVFGWKKLAKFPPFSWADKGARKGIGMVKDSAGSITKTAMHPFRKVGRLGMNVLRMGGRAGGKALDVTVLELYRDLKKAINHKFDFPAETNPLAALLTAIKGGAIGLIHIPGNIVNSYMKAFSSRPTSTLIGTALAIGLVAEAGGILPAAQQLASWFMQIISGVAGKVGPAVL